jgi:hypothetical protein
MRSETNRGGLMPLARACDEFERVTGYRPDPSAVWRWALKGKLECRRIGSRWFTTAAAVRDFLERSDARRSPTTAEAGEAAAARLRGRIGRGRRRASA